MNDEINKIHHTIIHQDTESNFLLVFLHDAIGSVTQWKDFPALLCKKMQLPGLVYDRKGHGHSPALDNERTTDYMHDYAWKELPALLEKLYPEKKYILVGHSDGGSIALLYASRFPEKVAAVVTMAAHVFVEEITLEGIRNTEMEFRSGEWMKKLTKHHGTNTLPVFEAWWKTWLSPEFRNWNIEDCLKNISAPCFVIQGKDDNYGTEDQVERIMNGISGFGKKWMIEGECGHAPWKTRKEECINEINAFLDVRLKLLE